MTLFRTAVLCCFIFVYAGSLQASTGLVLSGGGAKGAYEVGVWRALCETGIASNITVMSGTSVGALNAALFASVRDCRKIESFWLKGVGQIVQVSYGKVTDAVVSVFDTVQKQSEQVRDGKISVGDAWMEGLFELGKKALIDVYSGLSTTNSYEGVLTTRGLRKSLDAAIPAVWDDSVPDVYATVLEKGQLRKRSYLLNTLDDSARIDRLCASAAFPCAFSTVTVDGHESFDGGWEEMGGDNVPIQPVIDSGKDITQIFVVYLDDRKHLARRIDRTRYPGVKIIEIIPSVYMGDLWSGTLDFDAEKAKINIRRGYKDAMNVLLKMWRILEH